MPIALAHSAVDTGVGAMPTVTFGWTAAAGNLLVAVLSTDVQGAPYIVGWTHVVSYAGSAGRQVSTAIYYKVAAGGETSVTPTSDYGGNCSACIMEFSGTRTSSVVDVSASATDTSVSSLTVTTGATTNADDVVVAGFAGADSTSPFTCSGYTVVMNSQPGSGACHGAAYKVVSATGTQSATGSYGGTQALVAGAVATFKQALISTVAAPPRRSIRHLLVR